VNIDWSININALISLLIAGIGALFYFGGWFRKTDAAVEGAVSRKDFERMERDIAAMKLEWNQDLLDNRRQSELSLERLHVKADTTHNMLIEQIRLIGDSRVGQPEFNQFQRRMEALEHIVYRTRRAPDEPRT
jgi:hypothetical protein